MLMDPTFTHWTAVYRSAGEDEPTATTADFSEMGAGDPVDARAAKAHFRTALGRGDELLELYPFDNPDEALETWRATNALEVAGL